MRHRARTFSHLFAVVTLAAGFGAAAAVGAVPASASEARDQGRSGQVYAISNDAAGNALVVFDRAADGRLTARAPIPTGGTGTGAGLGSQGAVVTSENGNWVLAVNPGSDEVSLFAVRGGQIALVDTQPSGGDQPVSVTVHGDTAYVLNAGAANGISGFRIGKQGLEPIAGSTQPLSQPAAGAAQVGFSNDGDHLVVTEKATDRIDTFAVRRGVAQATVVNPSTGKTPFGFAVDRRGRILVSNANGGAAGASSLSSYRLARDGALVALDGPDGTNQTAACWVVVSNDGRHAYTTNTGSASISGYALGRDGEVELLDADGVTATTGQGPIDVDLSRDGRYLYTLNTAADTISIHRYESDGSLTAVGSVAGLPASAVGLAAS